MSLRDIIRIFLHANQERLIQKLSESYPFRRAAQLTAYFFQKGKERIEEIKESETVDRLRETAQDKTAEAERKKDESIQRVNNFFHNFLSELDKEWEKEKKKLSSGTESTPQDKEKKDK